MSNAPFTFTITSFRAALDQSDTHAEYTSAIIRKKDARMDKWYRICIASVVVFLVGLTLCLIADVIGVNTNWGPAVKSVGILLIRLGAIIGMVSSALTVFLGKSIEKIRTEKSHTTKTWGVENEPTIRYVENLYENTFNIFLEFPDHEPQYVGSVESTDEIMSLFENEKAT